MSPTRTPSRTFVRPVLMTLAALALIVRVFIPQGFMVSAADADHGSRIVLCSGQTVMADAGHVSKPAGGETPDRGTQHDQACPFAGHGLADAPAHMAHAAPVVFFAEAAVQPTPAERRPQLQPAGPPLPARGPPAIV